MGWGDFCLIRDACCCGCPYMGSRLCVFRRSTLFCVIRNLLMFVSNDSGDHNGGNVLEYGSYYGFVCCVYHFLFVSLSICIFMVLGFT